MAERASAPASDGDDPPAGAGNTGVRASIGLLRRNADFRRLYLAGIVSLGGDWFLTVALFDVVLRLKGTALSVALVIVAQELPLFFMSPVGGILADRLDRRRLVIACDLARSGICLAFLLVRNGGDLWLILVLLPVLSAFSAAFDPAIEAAAPNLVESRDLAAANSLLGSAWGTMLAVGAALGGVVVALFGSDTAFIVDAISFVGSALLMWRIHRPFNERSRGEHPSAVQAIKETGVYARRDHRVLALLSVKGGFGLAAGVLVLIPVFGEEVFKAGAVGIGLLMGARGLGALIGPFLGRWFAGADDRRLFHAIGLSLAVFGASYVVLGLAPSIAIAAAVVFCAHLGGGTQWALSTYGLQRIVPDFIRGRIFSFDFAFVTLTLAISSVIAGWAADRFGPRQAVIGLGALALVWSVAWWFATGDIRRNTDLEAGAPGASPGTPPTAEPARSGEGPDPV